MRWEVPGEVAEMLDDAQKSIWLPNLDGARQSVMGRSEIEGILPHRDPFLFLSDIFYLDQDQGLIGARYDLERGRLILSGHFPNAPTWPGIFQVEAITQAGGLLFNYNNKIGGAIGLLTNIIAARFMQSVTPGEDLFIISKMCEYGQMTEIIGQCIQRGKICSVAAVRVYSLAEEL
jgi:3-hydroxyacyl-[acyl-carrier-protein] dehydratase